MKNKLLFFGLLFFIKICVAQPPCLPTAGGIIAGNDPPGCFVCGPIYQGSTAGYNAGSASFTFPCGTIENNQWIAFVADASGTTSAIVLSSNCTSDKGVEMAMYDESLNLVSNCFSSNGTNIPGNVTASGLVPGNTYFIMIDGFEGDVCDILLTMSRFSPGPPDPPGPMRVAPPVEQICVGIEICFMIDPVNGATGYDWDYPEASAVVTFESDLKLCLKFNSIDSGAIVSVEPFNRCFPLIPAIVEIKPNSEAPCVRVCRNDFPFEIGGHKFYEYGWHEVEDPSIEGCAGNFRFELIPDTLLESVNARICKGDVWWIDTFSFTRSGNYEIFLDHASKAGCDSLVFLDLTVVDSIDLPHRTTDLSALICPGDTIRVNDLPFFEDGNHVVVMENVGSGSCDSTVFLELKIPQITPPKIECFPDSFLNAMTIQWEERPYSDGYEIRINDSLVAVQDFRGYLYFPQFAGEIFNIEILPFGAHDCEYMAGTSVCEVILSSSSEKFHTDEPLKIIPNPTHDIFRIDSKNRIISSEVFDFSGKKILESEFSKINLSAFPGGIYFLKIKTPNGVFLKKVLKI